MKPQTLQIVRQGEATPYWFKFSPLYIVTKHLMRQYKPGKTLQNFANRLRNIGGYWDFLILKDGFGVFLSNERI